ncbi:hypothetical protein CEXT_39181 [Caerostris extrusa]|uniref:Uncharacterized protein n=1 Tax=Caerostris extrusa TaxID=172846 RepID=A0AAV4NL02_CAEEX|nr:hypothetical protein CEXT_39181 [Caerostris extrusa]
MIVPLDPHFMVSESGGLPCLIQVQLAIHLVILQAKESVNSIETIQNYAIRIGLDNIVLENPRMVCYDAIAGHPSRGYLVIF